MTHTRTSNRRGILTLVIVAFVAFALAVISADRHPAVTAVLFGVGFLSTAILALDVLAIATDDLDDDPYDDDEADEREAERDENALAFVASALDRRTQPRQRGKHGR